MTIYLVKWKNKTTGENNYYACSSYVKANKKIAELNKNPNFEVLDTNLDGVVYKACPYKLKGQKETIDFLNNVLFNDSIHAANNAESSTKASFKFKAVSTEETFVH